VAHNKAALWGIVGVVIFTAAGIVVQQLPDTLAQL
jgi:hypothetical protein